MFVFFLWKIIGDDQPTPFRDEVFDRLTSKKDQLIQTFKSLSN